MMRSVTPITLEQNSIEISGLRRLVDREHANLAHTLELKLEGIFIVVSVFSQRTMVATW